MAVLNIAHLIIFEIAVIAQGVDEGSINKIIDLSNLIGALPLTWRRVVVIVTKLGYRPFLWIHGTSRRQLVVSFSYACLECWKVCFFKLTVFWYKFASLCLIIALSYPRIHTEYLLVKFFFVVKDHTISLVWSKIITIISFSSNVVKSSQ